MVYWGDDSKSMKPLWILCNTISDKFDKVITSVRAKSHALILIDVECVDAFDETHV